MTLAHAMRANDEDAIVRACERLAHLASKGIHFPGGDYDDVVNVARWGIAYAWRTFDPPAGVRHPSLFIQWAHRVARQRVLAELTHHTAKKRLVCVQAARFEEEVTDGITLGESIVDVRSDPADIAEANTQALTLLRNVAALPPHARREAEARLRGDPSRLNMSQNGRMLRRDLALAA